jgi:hypothetical protein
LVLASCFSEQGGGDGDGDDGDDSSSFTAVDTSASTTSGTTTVDASTSSVGDVTGTDTTTESGTSDTEGSSTTGDPSSFCDELDGIIDGVPVLTCLDFDEGDALDGWTIIEGAGGGVTFGAPADESPPHPPAMGAAVPVAPSQDAAAGLSRALGGLSLPLHFQFALHLETCIADVRLAEIVFPGPTPVVVFLQMTPTGVALGTRDATGRTALHALDPDVLLDAGPWARWRIATDPLSGYVAVFVDEIVAAQVTGISGPARAGDAPSLRVGALDGDPAGCAVWFDEIVAY